MSWQPYPLAAATRETLAADRAQAVLPERLRDRLPEEDKGDDHGPRQDPARGAAPDGAVPHHRDRLSRRRDRHQGLLARRGCRAVRRARHRLVRAEGGAGGDGRDARSRALPLCRRGPVRQAVRPRPDQHCRPPGQPDRAGRRAVCGDREPAHRKNDGPGSRLRPRPVRRFGDEHADAAGGHRDARQRRPGSGLLGFLPARRGRADPVSLLRVHVPQAEDRYHAERRHGDARDRASQPGPLRPHARRGHERAAAPGEDRGAAHRAPQPAGCATGTSSRRTTSCSSSHPTRKCSSRPGGIWARRRPAASSRTAAISTICASSPRGRAWWAGRSAISRCRATRRWSSPTSAAATPTSCRAPTSCSSSATASALLAHRDDFSALRAFFGDSIKGTAEFSYVSIGLGMALGLLLGAIRIPLPGIGTSLGRPVGRPDRGAGPGQPAAHAAASTGPSRCRPTSCCATWGSRSFSRRSGWLRGPSSPRR